MLDTVAENDVISAMAKIGVKAKAAATVLSSVDTEAKN